MNVNNGINQYSIFSNPVKNATTTQNLANDNISSLKEGQVFEGSINHIDENGKVTIGLANGQTMTARLDTGVSIQEGQSLFFQVKSNDGSLVQIKPVSLTLESNPTLLKALDTASISVSDKTLSMVDTMMKESMSIDSESLLTMNKNILANPGIDSQTVVLMTKFNIPVSTENANMFEAYSKNEAAIANDITQLSNSITNVLSDKNLPIDQAISLNEEISNIFSGNITQNTEQVLTEITSENFEISTKEAALSNNEAVIIGQSDTQPQLIENQPVDEKMIPIIKNFEEGQTVSPLSPETESEIANLKTEEKVLVTQEQPSNVLGTSLSEKQLASLQESLKSLPGFTEKAVNIFDENGNISRNIDSAELHKAITQFIKENPSLPEESVRNLFSSTGFKHLLQNTIKNEFSLNMEDITKKDSISKLYEKVLKETDAIEKAFESIKTKSASEIKTSAEAIKSNVSFMNSSNEIYNFVQVPIKMFDQNAESTLYVRQNKKHLYENGGEITCYLHFDMKYLGPTDIYVKLKEKNVNCNWYLQDEKSLDLIESHLDLLNARLNAKGYNISNEVSCQEKQADFVNDFLKTDTLNNSTEMVHRYSFDMRA